MIVCLMLTMLPTSAFAAGENGIAASTAKVKAGETFVVTLKIPSISETLSNIEFNISFDNTVFDVTEYNQPSFATMSNTPAEANAAGRLTCTNVSPTGDNDITALQSGGTMTATFKAKDTAVAGSYSFTVSKYEIKSIDETTHMPIDHAPTGTVKVANVEVVSELTGDLPVTIAKPAKGNTPVTNISGTNFTGSINWTPAVTGGKFAADTPYIAEVILNANPGYQFVNGVNPIVAGATEVTGVDVRDGGSKLKFNATFPKTDDKNTPVCVAPTGVTATFGSALSTITLTNPTGNTAGTWSWMDDAQKVGNVKDNPHTYKAKFVPNDTTNFSTVENIDVTVNAKQVVLNAGYPIMIPIEVDYTGSAIEPIPTIKTDNHGDALVLNQDYKITKYEDNTNVGTGKIFIEPLANGNYSFTAGSYTFTIKAGTSSISITGDPSKPYDGTAVTDPTVSKSGSTGAVTYTYYTNEDCTTKTTTASGAVSDGAAPKNAGDYWVKATLAADSNHDSATSAAKKFTISQKALTNDMIILGTQTTYDGTAHGPVYSVKDGATVLNKGTDYTETSGYSPVTNVGNTTLKISGAGNYKGTAQKDWSLVAKEVTITPDAKSKTYGAADPTLTYTTSIDSDAALKAKFDAAVGTTKLGRVAGEDVGSYAINLGTLEAGNNFNLTPATTPVYLAITPKNVADAEVTATISDQTTIKGVGEFVDPVIKGVKGEDLTGTLTYGYDSETGKSHTDVVNMLKGKNANDEVTLTYTFTPPAGNYTGIRTGSFKVTVKDIEFLVNGTPATVANTLTVKANPTYGDDWSDIVKIKDGVTITARVGTATDIDQSHFTLRPTGKPSAGNNQTYELVYNGTINGTNYANVIVASGTVNVAPKTLTAADLTYSSPITKVYDGSDSAPTGLTVSVKPDSLVGTDTLTVTGTLKYNSANVNEADKITFTPTAITTGNYALAASEVLTITGAKITAKDVKLTGGINATDRSYVKDNKTVDLTKGTLTFDGLVSGETLDVNIPATGTISDAKVGAYNVTYSGVTLKDGTTGKASNYKLVSPLPAVMVNITKASAPTLANIPVSQKYTVTTGEKAIGTVMPADAGTLTYTKDTATPTSTVTSWDVDSTGKVTYTLSGGAAGDTVTLPVIIKSTNYADATVKVVITLTAKDNQAALTLTGGTTVVYGETLQLGTSGGNGTGTVTYTVINDTGEATIDSNGILTPVEVGTVKVKATKAEDANYNAITSAEKVITITRATPTGAPKYTAITTSGKTLAEAGLTTAGSNLSVPGTVKWVDDTTGADLPDTTTVEANKLYKWVFTPNDSANYTTLTGSIVVYRASTGIVIYSPCYTIKASAGANGTISPAGWCSVVENGSQTFTFTPDKGYTVAKVLVDGKSVGAVKSYTFKNVTKDHTIEVIFMKSNGNPATGVFVMP